MKLMVSGHRRKKLEENGYDINWIEDCIIQVLEKIKELKIPFISYVGMADGVDLKFCEVCNYLEMPYIACIPFEEQNEYMCSSDKLARDLHISAAKEIKKVKNSWMVEHCDEAIVVWDGNKGGTANVIQQLVEKNIPFTWINPVGKKVWRCF